MGLAVSRHDPGKSKVHALLRTPTRRDWRTALMAQGQLRKQYPEYTPSWPCITCGRRVSECLRPGPGVVSAREVCRGARTLTAEVGSAG